MGSDAPSKLGKSSSHPSGSAHTNVRQFASLVEQTCFLPSIRPMIFFYTWMKLNKHSGILVCGGRFRTGFLAKFVIFTLLLSVAGLATLAKNGQYFPKASVVHHVSISTKMNVVHFPAYFAGDHLKPVTILMAPPMPANREENLSAPPLLLRVCLRDFKQRRAPPPPLA